MTPHQQFLNLLTAPAPVLTLAPMQDVTDLPFWTLMHRYGGPDVYWTEYFRVHGDSKPEAFILRSIIENPTGRPAIAQLIGNDVSAMVRNAKELQKYNVAAIDLNLGCPAPVVYRKCAGGGLLRDPNRIDSLLGALRDAVSIAFTVKTRIGFESPEEFDTLLPLFQKHSIDLLTVHGRTVTQMYRPGVRYDLITRAAREMKCPVIANGNVHGAKHARHILEQTGVRGLMIGRGAIRNPWLFDQIRAELNGQPVKLPTGRHLLNYIHELWAAEVTPDVRESAQVQRLKKFMNFIGEGIGAPSYDSASATGAPNSDSARPCEQFLFQIRRVETKADFFRICEQFLDHDHPMTLDPDDPNRIAGLQPARQFALDTTARNFVKIQSRTTYEY